MSLIQALGLPTPPRQSASAAPPPRDEVRAAADALRPALGRQRDAARERVAQLGKLRPALAKMADAATGAGKAGLVAKQAALEREATTAAGELERANADLAAIDHPATSREEMVALLARRRAAGSVAKKTEIDVAKLGGGGSHDIQTTTTGYEKGRASKEVQHDSKRFGLGGRTQETNRQVEVKSADLTARATDGKKTNLSLKGERTSETTRSREIELADGRKAGIEEKTTKKVGPKGASVEKVVQKTNLDGSSSANVRSASVERGDGKLGAAAGVSNTKTDATGLSTKNDTSANAGASLTGDSAGAHGGVDAGKTVTGKGGRQFGAKLSLHANVSFTVGKPTPDTPPLYPVTLAVSFAASGSVSAGAGKQKGSSKSASVTVEKSVTKDMLVTHLLTEAQLGDYTKALQAAQKKGGKVADARREFQVISAGVNHGWDLAGKMWASGGSLSDMMASLQQAGDSVTVKEGSSNKAGAQASAGAVSVGASDKRTSSNELSAKRRADGKLDVEAKGARGREREANASVDIGAVNLSVGQKVVHETRFGFSFTLDPKMDPSGAIQKWMEACKTRDAYTLFYSANRHAVTLTGSMEGTADSEASNVGVGIGSVKMGIQAHSGLDDEVRRDGAGKVIGRKTVAESGAGGTFAGLGDSQTQRAVAETDEKGESTLTLSTEDTSNYGGGVRKTLARAVGIGKNTNSTDKVRLKLSSAELKAIGASVCRSIDAWNGQRVGTDERKDWEAAGKAIKAAGGKPAAVSLAISTFLGQDIARMDTVHRYVRGVGNDRAVGQASEFPQELAGLQDDYDTLVSDTLSDTLNDLAVKDAPKAVAECERLKRLAVDVAAKVRSCKTFTDQDVRSEMLSRLEWRRDQLAKAVLGYAGKNPDNDPKLLTEKTDQLMKQCVTFSGDQQGLFGELNDLLGPDDRFAQHDGKEVWSGIHKLENMQKRWDVVVDEYDDTQRKLGRPPGTLPPMFKPLKERTAFYRKTMGG